MTSTATNGQLRAFFERIERLHEERTAIGDDIKEVFAEAKGNGFDTKVMKIVLQKRRMDAGDRAEQDALVDLYMRELDMVESDDPSARAPARENIEEFGAESADTGRVAQSGSAPQKRSEATVTGSLPDASSEVHEPRVGSNPTPTPDQSTAALMEVLDNSTEADPAPAGPDQEAATTPPADTQAPPVDTFPRNSKGIRKPEGCQQLDMCRVAGWRQRCVTCETAYAKAHADAEGLAA